MTMEIVMIISKVVRMLLVIIVIMVKTLTFFLVLL